ncbi:MAG TPA: hypothetical protein VF756_30735 [Thermoanaerobaculia bacterium]
MIIWSEWGFLVAVIVFVSSLLMEIAVESRFNDDSYYQTQAWPLALALVIAGAICWFWGKGLNQAGSRHRLFFIPMQYWGPILGVIAVVVFFTR